MSAPEGHEPRLVRYLLGDLPGAEQEAVEEAYVSRGDAFDRLLAAEDDLIDAYVAGSLAEADRRRFEDHFLASPERRERTAFARALAATREGRVPASGSRRRAWLPAAAVLAAALAGGLLLARVRRLDGELALARTRHEAAARASDEAQRRAVELDLEVRRLREERSLALGRPLPAARVLAPGLERGAPASPVPVPAEAAWLRLQLLLEADEHPRYRAAVLTADGKAVARFEGLRSRAGGGGRVVELMVPPTALDQDVYVVALAGVPARGAPEDLASYALRLTRAR